MSKPIVFPPPPFSKQEAIDCGNLVNVAYDMYSTWKSLNKPDQETFKSQWKPKQPSSSLSVTYSDPIWGNDEIFKEGNPEPFAFVAWTDDGKVYLAIRGTESADDTLSVPDIMANTDFTPENTKQYNFASPKVGDADFADPYDDNGVATYRIVNTSDIVPDVPKSLNPFDGYDHIEQLVSFRANYGSVVANHSLTGCYLYAMQNPDNPKKT